MSGPAISVVVPTYRRPGQLLRCLEGITAQSRAPSEVIVVRRADDAVTAAALEGRSDVIEVTVDRPGVVDAMIAGAGAAFSGIVAFVDDDAVPRRDWIARLADHFQDPSIGGVGGRDVIRGANGSAGPEPQVGWITRAGKLVGNHHLGRGPWREVEVLKGANMAFRRSALAFPEGLRGAGAQPHFEVATCLWASSAGWRIIYDPSIVVDHTPGERFDADGRTNPAGSAVSDSAYNLVASLLAGRPSLASRRALFGLVVGDRGTPGLGRAAAAVVSREPDVAARLVPSLRGQAGALRDFAGGRRLRPIPIGHPAERPREPVTVALVAHDIHELGGMERSFAELIRRAQGRVRFIVVARTLQQDLRHLVDWRRVRVPARPFPLKFASFYLLAGGRLRGIQADIVHTMGAIVPTRPDVASVHFCHAAYCSSAGGLAPQGLTTLRRLNSRVARLLSLVAERRCYVRGRHGLLAAVSPQLVAELTRHFAGSRLALTPNGVDALRFRSDEAARRRLRLHEGVAEDEVVALFVGGDWSRKGLAVAIEGLAYARAHGAPRLLLWVVGRGDTRAFRALSRRWGVDRAVRFFGITPEIECFYQAADMFVLPTLYETFCLAAYEAAACGLPVVATAVGGIEDLVQRDGGILVVREAPSVGRALARLAADPELREMAGASAQRRARRYTWGESVARVVELYARLAPASANGASR